LDVYCIDEIDHSSHGYITPSFTPLLICGSGEFFKSMKNNELNRIAMLGLNF
jgi:hypothetical protein